MSKTVCFITRNFGKYDPDSLKGYESIGGFRALRKALTMEGCDIADVLAANGVQGRGGAAYDMGKKWRQAREVPGAHKCVVCNADEGEPGTFKDRELLTHDPFQLLEGMIIAGWGRTTDTSTCGRSPPTCGPGCSPPSPSAKRRATWGRTSWAPG